MPQSTENGISSDDVYIRHVGDASHTITALQFAHKAPEQFSDITEIETYVTNNFDIGEYDILIAQHTVEVTPAHELYADYTTADMEILDTTETRFRNRDDSVRVSRITDPGRRAERLDYDGTEISADAETIDLLVEMKTYDDPEYDVLSDIKTEARGLKVVGWKSSTHYESRGDHGTPTLTVGLKRIPEPLHPLYDIVYDLPTALVCVPAHAVGMQETIKFRAGDSEMVLVTSIGLPQETNAVGDTPGPQQILDTYNDSLQEFSRTLAAETDWEVHTLGSVTTTNTGDGAFYRLALGLSKGY